MHSLWHFIQGLSCLVYQGACERLLKGIFCSGDFLIIPPYATILENSGEGWKYWNRHMFLWKFQKNVFILTYV